MEIEFMGISMSLTRLLGMFTLGLVVLYVGYTNFWTHSYWKRLGLPYEPALPIFGNPIFTSAIPQNFEKWSKKYGKVYGTYSFSTPVIVIGDPEILRHLLVKSFNNFHSRIRFPAAIPEELQGMVSIVEGERWKEIRNILTPTFSGAKMKQMSNLVNASADSLVKHLGIKQKEKGYIECLNIFGAYVMDTIGSCAFGLNIDSQSDPQNPFVTNAKRTFQFDLTNPFFIIGSLIPALGRIFSRFRLGMFIPADVLDFFKEVNKKTIALRKDIISGSDSKRMDFLQLLLDAQKQENVNKVFKPEEEEDDDDGIHADLDKYHDVQYHSRGLGKKAPLTDNEVLAQVLIFFTAGSETTTTLLGFIAYALATNPEVQEKLIDEIEKMAPSRDDVGYKSVSTMPYLDQVVCETLRLFPPAAVSNRMCHETFVHNGMKIEKGTQVFIPVYTIHHDPDYWPEPEKFIPERFTKEARTKQHPFAWQPFGAGPRNCIGMRFALMEAKMAVVRMLQNYRFDTCAQTEIPPKFNKTGFLSPPNGITLKVVPRIDKIV